MTEELNKFSQKTELIDDYLYTILLLKTSDCSNRSLLFLQAHLIELLIKTTCDKLSLDYSKNHDLISIGRLLATHLPALTSIIPTDEDLIKYRDVWIPGDGSQNTVHLPPIEMAHEMMDKYEMALMMKHSVNLKYIYDKKEIAVSNIHIAHN